MNKEWSEKNKRIQTLLSRESTFGTAVDQLVGFRKEMFEQITCIMSNYPPEAFSRMPFSGADGYHSKTLAYSVWHIFRIEDIVAHEMIAGDRQVFFERDFDRSVHSPVITTGNELSGDQISVFSARLDYRQLYRYAKEVKEATDRILQNLCYADLKRGFDAGMKEKLHRSGCISRDEKAVWLIDYWCGKDIRGLIRMPFTRHWIMHIEAMCRIKNRLCALARKGVDPVAYCGFSCNHCFLGKWCGSCRTSYNVCSFATTRSDGRCPNAECCGEKGIDGCYACDFLRSCEKGFYSGTNEGANAAKAQALYIQKHGKKAFLQALDRLCEKYDFAATQRMLDRDPSEGLQILEET